MQTKSSKIIALIIIAILAISGIFYFNREKKNGDSLQIEIAQPIKIGIIGHFSGDYASYGIPMKNAAELAINEINKDNEQKFELMIEDDNSDSNKAASAINKLISIDGANYIILAQGSGATSAITPIIQNSEKIGMITLASAPNLTEIGENIFRSVPSDVYQAIKMVDFINNNLNSKKVAGLYVNDAYGMGIKKIINSNDAIINSASESFESGSADFKTQLLKIKESEADTLVIAARKEYPAILKQITELELNVKIIASETFKDEEILKECGDSAKGVYATFPKEPKDYVDFNNNYKAKFGEAPSAFSMYAYDGTMALIKALQQRKKVEDVRNYLSQLQFNGASGKVGFDSSGDRTGSEYVIYEVRNGEFIEIE